MIICVVAWHLRVVQCQATVLLINFLRDYILDVVCNVRVICGGNKGVVLGSSIVSGCRKA